MLFAGLSGLAVTSYTTATCAAAGAALGTSGMFIPSGACASMGAQASFRAIGCSATATSVTLQMFTDGTCTTPGASQAQLLGCSNGGNGQMAQQFTCISATAPVVVPVVRTDTWQLTSFFSDSACASPMGGMQSYSLTSCDPAAASTACQSQSGPGGPGFAKTAVS